MKLLDVVVSTGVARRGMSVGQAFEVCVRDNVPGLPFLGEQETVEGRFSIRNILKSTCIPGYLVDSAHLLGDEITHVTMPSVQVCAILNLPVESYILENKLCVSPESPIDKALAIMDQANTNYVFLRDCSSL